KIFVSLGISTNFFINHKITTYQYFEDNKFEKNTTKNSYYKFNSINFSILVGMGLEYEINELLKLKIEPIYRRSINSIIDAPIKSHLFSIGLGTALYYKF
ncbi:MAG: hypothetical protein U9R42_15010, partial [Bacteroidota bacterium]|nr:hypothetical protein [Bacteroidota bacterium]